MQINTEAYKLLQMHPASTMNHVVFFFPEEKKVQHPSILFKSLL